MHFTRSWRSLASRPVLTAVAILTLALGLGVNAAIFSLTREVLLKPLPYPDADRLVRVFESSPTLGRTNAAVAPVNYLAWRDRVDAFEQTATFRRVSFNVGTSPVPVQVEGFQVAPEFFPMLGVEPATGRGFSEQDAQPGHDAVVVVTDGFWHRALSADPRIVGRSIDVDGVPCTIVGVLAPSFRIYHVLNRELDVFRPLVVDRTEHEHSLNVYAKLKANASADAAAAQLAVVYASLPAPDQLWTAGVESLSTSFGANARPILLALEWAAALVLLIACANIANLLLAVSAGRTKELAVRQALGASRWQIARDLAGETVVLVTCGGAVATLLAAWIVAGLNGTVSFQDVNRLEPFRIDGWVLAFIVGLTLIVAIVFSLLPARLAKKDLLGSLRDSAYGTTAGVSHRRLRHGLIVGELALAIVLTASAFALTRSAVTLQRLSRGMMAHGVMTAQVSLNGPRYDDPERLVRVAQTMLDGLASSPGITDAALVNYPPLGLVRVGVPVSIEGRPPPSEEQPWIARYWATAPGYFHTMGVPIVAGRDFRSGDDARAAGVAIVSETFARRFWNSTEVVGRRIATHFPESTAFWIPRSRRGPLTIVGVVGDVHEDGLLEGTSLTQLYLPYAQNPTVVVTLLARASGGPVTRALPMIRAAVRTGDPQAPVSYEMSLDDSIAETFARPREMAWLVGAFATLALLLSGIGVYGVMTHLSTTRGREIGIRVALGATRRDIVSLVIGQALVFTAAGGAIGVLATPVALRSLGGILFGVGPFDLTTLAAVVAVLTGVAIAASLIPALRAARGAAISFR